MSVEDDRVEAEVGVEAVLWGLQLLSIARRSLGRRFEVVAAEVGGS